MKQFVLFALLCFSIFSCKNEDAVENEIANIETNFIVERFDRAFAEVKPEGLSDLKKAFPFLFYNRIPDSIWFERIQDSNQVILNNAIHETFEDFKSETNEIEQLFQHLKFYDKNFTEPRVITLTNFVDYRNKVAVTDTVVLIAVDNYLGNEHEVYSGIPAFISQNMKPSQIVVDLAQAYSERQIFQSRKRTLLDEMVYFGKQLYFKDKMIPFTTDAEKIGYTPEQLEFARLNEGVIWTEFVEKEMLYDTDSSLPARFIADAPFSKFYLELDSKTPGRLGQYIGWQIVRAYMKNNEVSLEEMMQTDAEEIFNKSNYKPPK